MAPSKLLSKLFCPHGNYPDVTNEAAENPPTALEKFPRGEEYYPVGLPPRNFRMGAKTLDVFRMVRGLRGRNVGDTQLLVANINANGDAEFRGLRELVFYEAVQDVLDEDKREFGRRVPVLLSSELNEEELGFEPMMERVRSIKDPAFEEAVYACVPKNMRHRRHKHKTLAELRALPGTKAYEIGLEKMEYVYQQIALVLCLKSKKLGHEREKPYNAATILAAQILGLDHRYYAYETRNFKGEEGDIPYRVIEQTRNRIDVSLLSAHDTLEILRPRELELEPDNPVQWIQAIEEDVTTRDTEMRRLEKRFKLVDRLYTRMIDRAESLSGVDMPTRTRLSESIAFQYASEIIMTLTESPEPLYQLLFKETGVLDVVERKKTLEVWASESTHLLPFECDLEEGESLEHYFLKFVNRLLHSKDGPFDCGVEQTGLVPGLRRKLKILAKEEGREEWERYSGWRLPYSYFDWRMLHQDGPALHPDGSFISPYEAYHYRFGALINFMDLIRGTTLENTYRQYMGMPENPTATAILEPSEELEELLTTTYLSPRLQGYFREHSG